MRVLLLALGNIDYCDQKDWGEIDSSAREKIN